MAAPARIYYVRENTIVNKIIPHPFESTMKKVMKNAAIILSFGLVLLGAHLLDLSHKLFIHIKGVFIKPKPIVEKKPERKPILTRAYNAMINTAALTFNVVNGFLPLFFLASNYNCFSLVKEGSCKSYGSYLNKYVTGLLLYGLYSNIRYMIQQEEANQA